ncbi:MAG: GtrA family protein [Candidatus Cloacimonetes bacterium]|nr:GtrA family protein [Candidatus Cloacimonadota bacterium]
MILLNYIIFAVFATILNLSSQFIYVEFTPFLIFKKEIAILFGTAIGLVVKYILDKLFIFKFQASNKAAEAKAFTLYSIMGVFTTIIFWGFEYTFIIFFPQSERAMYVGAIIGLSIGYIVKYSLDKKYVFKPE